MQKRAILLLQHYLIRDLNQYSSHPLHHLRHASCLRKERIAGVTSWDNLLTLVPGTHRLHMLISSSIKC
jgi:hypothetical protein